MRVVNGDRDGRQGILGQQDDTSLSCEGRDKLPQNPQDVHREERDCDKDINRSSEIREIREDGASFTETSDPSRSRSVEGFNSVSSTEVSFAATESKNSHQSWRHLFAIESQRYSLDKKIINKVNDKFILPYDVIERGSVEWKKILVGFFFDSKLSFRQVEWFLRRRWKLKGTLTINADRDMFYLKFSSDEDRKIAIDDGPMFINGRVFVIREWSVNVEVEKMNCKSIPIWLRFWDIPKFLWNREGLSYLASCVGTPLFTDSITMEKKRMGYARMCVEVNTEYNFPGKLEIHSGSLDFEIELEYQWTPHKCRNCSCFGHQFHQCKKPTRRDKEMEDNGRIEEEALTNDKTEVQVQDARLNEEQVSATEQLCGPENEHPKNMDESVIMEEVTRQEENMSEETVVFEEDKEKSTQENTGKSDEEDGGNVPISNDKQSRQVDCMKEKEVVVLENVKAVEPMKEKQKSNSIGDKQESDDQRNKVMKSNQDKSKQTEDIRNNTSRKIMGLREVTHVQKDRSSRNKTGSEVSNMEGQSQANKTNENQELDDFWKLMKTTTPRPRQRRW